MKFNNVVIESTGYYVPEKYLSSDELESKLAPIYNRLKLPFGRLELQTGIKRRGYWDKGTRPSYLSSMAAQRCLEKSHLDINQIGLLTHAAVCRDFLEPATASVVHNNLKLNNGCMFFDLSNACLGVMSSMMMAGSMIERGDIQAALIVSGENGGPLLFETIDFLNNNQELTRKTVKPYIANLTIGSAATAILLCHRDLAPDKPRLLSGITRGNTEASALCQGSGDTNALMMQTDSEQLLKAGVELVESTWNDFLKINEWDNGSIDRLIGHQVGTAHRNAILDAIDFDFSKDFSTYELFGNTGSSALPLTLMKAFEEDQIQTEGKIALLGIGSGLSTTMLGVEW